MPSLPSPQPDKPSPPRAEPLPGGPLISSNRSADAALSIPALLLHVLLLAAGSRSMSAALGAPPGEHLGTQCAQQDSCTDAGILEGSDFLVALFAIY